MTQAHKAAKRRCRVSLPHDHTDKISGTRGEGLEEHKIPTVPAVAQSEFEAAGLLLELR
jgi:hypothetical protein